MPAGFDELITQVERVSNGESLLVNGSENTFEKGYWAKASERLSEVTNKLTDYLDVATLGPEGDEIGTKDQDTLIKRMMTNKMSGVEGLPYQFLPSTDRRMVSTDGTIDIGRMYANKIMTRLPLLFLTPCRSTALPGFSDEDKKTIVTIIAEGITDNGLSDLIEGEGRYYNTTFAYDEYYLYLNCMLASVVSYLGLYDKSVTVNGHTGKLGQFNWEYELNDDFKTFFDARENVVFYLDSFNSISESFSNDTTESSIASQINSVSETAREIDFLLGGNSSILGKLKDNVADAVSSVSDALLGNLGDALGGSIVGSLASSGINTLANGGKIIFPKIWSNSDYSRSYTLTIKLRSPDHDSLSIFFNILKPYCKLLALTLPRVMGGTNTDDYNVNAYQAPFLVKAFSKGMFNIDMGIIRSMSVNKGGEGMWNDDGLPTQMDIDIEVEDLYSALAMSGFAETKLTPLIHPFQQGKQLANIVNNTAYMDFLANAAGLNVGQMAIGRRIKMYQYLARNVSTSFASRRFNAFDRGVSKFLSGMYNRF